MTTALDMQGARAAAIARELVGRSPAGSVECVFAGGSLSRGEVFAAGFDGLVEIYSDVDLYVVTQSVHVAAVRRVARELALAAPAVAGARFMRPPDIGVYSAAELGALAVRPGTVDLAARRVLLHGDAPDNRVLRAAGPGDIAPEEALYLLENRMVELRAAGREVDDAQGRLNCVVALKARLDVHSAHLIVTRSFSPSLDARRMTFLKVAPATMDDVERAGLASAYDSAANLDAWLRETDADVEVRSAMQALARAWRALAPQVMRLPPETPVERLIERRCNAGDRWNNFRAVLRLRHHARMPLGVAAVPALSLSWLSPRTALRVDALIRQMNDEATFGTRDFARHQRYMDRLTTRFGFVAGTPETRVREMHKLISQG